jgi:hypothetical protein
MLAIVLSYITIIMWVYTSSIDVFFKTFIIKGCLIYSKTFSAFVEMIMWFLSLLMFICCITFIDLPTLKHNHLCGMKLTLPWFMTLWIHCQIWFASILLTIFASMFIKEIGLFSSLFLLHPCQIWNECKTNFIEWVW